MAWNNPTYYSPIGEEYQKEWTYEIEVRLMGEHSVWFLGEKVCFPYQKAEGLFYYLCVNNRITRNQAISVLWADSSEAAARKNLRDAIYHIRKVLGQDILLMEGNTTIVLNRQRDIGIDIEWGKEEELGKSGEFLQFFFVKNCYGFEAWAQDEREERKRDYMKALREKIMNRESWKVPDFLEESSQILMKNAVFEEEIYRSIMYKLAEAGRYRAAIEVYQSLQAFLEKEAEAKPEEKTRKLHRMISRMKTRMKRLSEEHKEHFWARTDILYEIYANLTDPDSHGKQLSSYLFTGGPGVGKSILLTHIRQMAQDMNCLTFSWICHEAEKEQCLRPWYKILAEAGEYCRKSGKCPESPKDILLRQDMVDTQVFFTRFALLAKDTFQYLEESVGGKQILLFVDDIQWMDIWSLRLISSLLFRMRPKRLLVMASGQADVCGEMQTVRKLLFGKGLVKEIELRPFTIEEVWQMLKEAGGDLVRNPAQVEQMYQRTRGNPLFFIESWHLYEKNQTEDVFTEKMAAAIAASLLNLQRQERTFLEFLSVCTRSLTIKGIEAARAFVGQQYQEVLLILLEKGYIEAKPIEGEIRYTFYYPVVRTYIYGKLSEERKIMYHRCMARYYEEEFQKKKSLELCSLLIYHYERCQDVYKMYWYKVEYLEAFYRVPYDFYPMLAKKAAFCNCIDGFLADEQELARLAKEIRDRQETDARMIPVRIKAEYLLGRYEMFVRDCRWGRDCIESSLKLAEKQGDRDAVFYNYLQLIFYGDMAGQTEYMHRWIEKCMDFMKGCPVPHLEEDCMLLRYRGICLMKKGRYAEGRKWLLKALRLLELAGTHTEAYQKELSVCYHTLGLCHILQKKWKQAYNCLMRAIEIGESFFLSGEVGVFYTDMSLVLCGMGKYEQAAQFVQKARKCFLVAGSRWGEAKVEMCCALLAKACGRCGEENKHREYALELSRKLDSKFLWNELQEMMEWGEEVNFAAGEKSGSL